MSRSPLRSIGSYQGDQSPKIILNDCRALDATGVEACTAEMIVAFSDWRRAKQNIGVLEKALGFLKKVKDTLRTKKIDDVAPATEMRVAELTALYTDALKQALKDSPRKTNGGLKVARHIQQLSLDSHILAERLVTPLTKIVQKKSEKKPAPLQPSPTTGRPTAPVKSSASETKDLTEEILGAKSVEMHVTPVPPSTEYTTIEGDELDLLGGRTVEEVFGHPDDDDIIDVPRSQQS